VAPNPDRELANARACIDRGDEKTALKRLDRARRAYAKRHESAGLEHVLVLADVLAAADEPTRIGRENLVYAARQNLRAESRGAALRRGEPWQDPYPDLQAPTEHTRISFTRGVKIAIGIGTALVTAVVVLIVVAPFFSDSTTTKTRVTLRLVNDAGSSVDVRGCDDLGCTRTWTQLVLAAGKSADRTVPADETLELFQLKRLGARSCLPLLVHEAYVGAGADPTVTLVARLSKSSPCPGAAVRPRALPAIGL
jgi:hypothetical protein